MYLHYEEEYGAVEFKSPVTIFNIIRINMNKSTGRIDSYLETRSTTVG